MTAKSVFVIEDDPDIREALVECLGVLGHPVEVASNGKEALERLRAAEQKPGLILLDIMMPVMDGWEFRTHQSTDPTLSEIPIVVITADGNAKQKAAKMGVKDGIRKPFDFDALFKVVQTYCQ